MKAANDSLVKELTRQRQQHEKEVKERDDVPHAHNDWPARESGSQRNSSGQSPSAPKEAAATVSFVLPR